MFKWVATTLTVLLMLLQWRLWQGGGSMADVLRLQTLISQQNSENDSLLHRNKQLEAEVQALKKTPRAIEERARYQLGMVKAEETFIQVVEPPQ
jgi:cell division protein FtsB